MTDDDLDPDAWEEQRRDADEHERDVLARHLAGGLAGDAELEERRALLGEIPPLDGPDYRCGAALTADRKSSSDLGSFGSGPWRDRQGDVWHLGADGLHLHAPDTRPFLREHVERKWGPLVPVAESSNSEGSDR